MDILRTRVNLLNIYITIKLEAIAATTVLLMWIVSPIIYICLFIYTLFTRFWYLSILYLTWMIFDKAPEKGGRRIEFLRNLFWWKYSYNYAQCSIVMESDEKFDTKQNYLFCCFPHGVLPAGIAAHFTCSSEGFQKYFPNHTPVFVQLSNLFYIPFYRDQTLAYGGISSSEKSLNYVLSYPKGGYIIGLLPGGVAEAIHTTPGKYQFVLRKRKGFVRIALQNGSPLVPVISFGEPDLYVPLNGPRLRRFQIFVKKLIGVVPIVPVGTGPLKITPRRVKVTLVVGKPIEVVKSIHPDQEEIDRVHKIFIEEISNLFDKYKFQHANNPSDTHLEIL